MPKAGTAWVDVVPRLERLRKDLEREMPQAADKAGRSFASRFSRSLGGIGAGVATAVGVGIAAAGTLAAAGLTKAVLAGSDLNETLSKTQQVFGANTVEVTRFAQEMADKFGLPKQAILDAAGSIGLIAKGAGLATPEASKMSTSLASLAADASSFYNVPLNEALDKIRSGLVGEAEPLRAFGVLLSESAVQAEAMALGLGKASGDSAKLRRAQLGVEAAQRRVGRALRDHGRSSKEYADAQAAVEKANLAVEESGKSANVELTEQQKVQARASLIAKGLATAQGDLGRTNDSLANIIRSVRGQFSNMSADLGLKLLPSAQRVGMVVRDDLVPAIRTGLTRAIEVLAPKIETSLVPAIERFAEKLPAITDNLLPQLSSMFERLGPFVDKSAEALSKFNFGDISKTSVALLALKAGAATGTPHGLALGAAIASGLGLNIALEKFGGEGTGDLGRLPGFLGSAYRWWENEAFGTDWANNAIGGPVRMGRGYTVGEFGPERFIPDQNGKILPASQSGTSGMGDYVMVMDGTQVGRLVDRRLARRQRAYR